MSLIINQTITQQCCSSNHRLSSLTHSGLDSTEQTASLTLPPGHTHTHIYFLLMHTDLTYLGFRLIEKHTLRN